MKIKISTPKFLRLVFGLFLVISLLCGFLICSTMAQSLKWKFQTGSIVYSSPAIGEDGTIYVGSDDYYLYAINPDGTQKWRFQTGGFVNSSPAIGEDGTIYVGSNDYYLYAINPDGTQKWKFQTGYNVSDSSPAIGEDGTIYVGSLDKYLYAINPDGTQKWRFQTGGDVYSSPPIGEDGTIYVGSGAYYLCALNPDGTQKWKFQTGYYVYSSPAIGSDGTIYVGSWDDYLYAINPDGTQKWKFQTGGDVYSSPPIGEDGTIYVGSLDHYLYALNSESMGLADSHWPKFRHDNQNTGRESPPIPVSPQVYTPTSGNNYVRLNWVASAEAVGYKVYRSATSGYCYTLLADVGDALTYTDTNVVNGESYYYVLTAYNQSGESEYSNEVVGKPAGSTTVADVWATSTVDSEGDVGMWTSLALDSKGNPHISYLDETNDDLKYAFYDGSRWNIQTVDSQGWVGIWTSLALDSKGYPHISYYGNGDLKYAFYDGSSWKIQTIEGRVGLYTSIALDSIGHPHISYYDYTNEDLKYAFYDGSSWNRYTVDSEGDMESDTSIALDSIGHPHISYYDYTNGDLKYAVNYGCGWVIQTVDSEGNVGSDTSLALDSSEHPHISYKNYASGDLKYAVYDGSSWNIQTVDSQGYVGLHTSIALDSKGYPHISYYDDTNYDLKYAVYDGSSWNIQTVDSQGAVGTWTSIALDSKGYPHISYYDSTNQDLKYATFPMLPVNRALSLDGDCWVEVNHTPQFDLSELTIECWIRTPISMSMRWRNLVSKEGGGSVPERDYNFYAASKDGVRVTDLHFSSSDNIFGASEFSLPVPFEPESWHHVAITISQTGQARYFADGVEFAQSQHEIQGIANREYPFRIGKADNFWNSLIDEVRLWNIVRSPAEIKDAWNRPLMSDEIDSGNLVGYWRFDSGAANDYSPYNNHGTLMGDAEIIPLYGTWPPPLRGDVSGNGTVSAYDAALILQYVVGLISEFPADSMGSPSAEPHDYELSLPTVEVSAGKKIEAPIAINDAKGLSAGGITIKYDQTVLRAIGYGSLELLNGYYWKANTNLPGEVRFAFATTEVVTTYVPSPFKGEGQGEGGRLLMVEFEVLPNAEGKTSPLILENVSLANSRSIKKINGEVNVIPSTFVLLQNFPNPFNPDTWIPYKLASSSPVTISIYNAKGQIIRTISLGNQNAGVYVTRDKAAYWDGKNNAGEKVTSGMYFYTIQAMKFISTRKMVIMK